MRSGRYRSWLARRYHGLPEPLRTTLNRAHVLAAPGRVAEASWAGRSESDAERYWDSVVKPHRRALIDALKQVGGVEALLELGCSAGPNLRLAADAFPGARLTGIDVNRAAIELGARRFAAAGIDVDLRAGSFRRLLVELPDSSEDIVFSCYALAYVPPRELSEVIEQVVRVARGAIVLAEPQLAPAGETPEWRHDYAAALAAAGVSAEAIEQREFSAGAAAHLESIVFADLRSVGTPA